MKKLVIGTITGGIVGAVLILLVMALFDKSRNRNREGLRLVTNDSTATPDVKGQQVLVYGDYLHLDSTDYLLIPIGMKTVEKRDSKILGSKTNTNALGGENAEGGFKNYKYNFGFLNFENCNNIIFYDKKSNETHLLLQQPAIISQFYFPVFDKEYEGKKFYFILLGVREYDSNADGYINADDAERLYISDLSGNNLVQVTPDNTQLVDWDIDMTTRTILMKVRFDSNKDHEFDAHDELEILKTSIDHPAQGEEILNKEIKANIKKILNKIK
jgi:hypothetical protein